jgi:hypothetical protein
LCFVARATANPFKIHPVQRQRNKKQNELNVLPIISSNLTTLLDSHDDEDKIITAIPIQIMVFFSTANRLDDGNVSFGVGQLVSFLSNKVHAASCAEPS